MTIAALLCLPAAGFATPFMWDQDGDGIDDRLESVAEFGLNLAYENLDPEGRLRFDVSLAGTVLQYGGYVRYDHPPTPADSLNAVLSGAQVVTRFQSVPYIRIRSSFATILLLSARPEIERIEAVTLMYSLNWKSERATGVRSGDGLPFPAIEDLGGPTGEGVVVAILDTGINDTPQGSFPGHADLAGRIAGGAAFDGPGPGGYTPYSGSVNPSQAGGLTTFHATHVAGTVAGSSRDRVFGGVAPGARLVDVKVLGDDGSGYGLAEALEWCIQNRNRNWGAALGIDVINLSLSGTDASDGNDCACQLVNATVAAGIIVVASAGNEGKCGYLPAPAAADGALTVGAVDVQDPGDPEDDVLAAFSNEGPRQDDQDVNAGDEMKPDVVAPGVGIISAYGSPLTDGFGYRTLSGTSMAAAFVSGLAAIFREEAPALTPAVFKSILRETARHRTSATKGCSQGVDPLGLDGRYHAGWGYGVVDAFAAREELLHPGLTQFVRVSPAWNGSSVDVEWTTQRENSPAGFMVQRAPDIGGVPGTFAAVGGMVPAVGLSNLASGNRTNYSSGDVAPAGQRFWYRVVTYGGGMSDVSASAPVWTETATGTASATFVHNMAEVDFDAAIGVGLIPAIPLWSRPVDVLNRLVAVSVDPLPASPNAVTYTIALPLYAADGAGTYLPPAAGEPWWLSVTDGGDPDRIGTLNAFAIETPSQTYVTNSMTPKLTVNGVATQLWIPEPSTAGAGPDPAVKPGLAAYPNPFRNSARIHFRLRDAETVRITIHDVAGREVLKIADRAFAAGENTVTWDGSGAVAGRYFVRILSSSGASVLPLTLVR